MGNRISYPPVLQYPNDSPLILKAHFSLGIPFCNYLWSPSGSRALAYHLIWRDGRGINATLLPCSRPYALHGFVCDLKLLVRLYHQYLQGCSFSLDLEHAPLFGLIPPVIHDYTEAA